MEMLVLANGDARAQRSWKGVTRSVVDQLRLGGHGVHVGDVELHGMSRWFAAGMTFAPDFSRWRSRFHLGELPFRLRSARAERHLRRHGGTLDLILQLGCTFVPYGRADVPYALYCNSNILLAERFRESGHTDATPLRAAEVARIAEREAAVYRDASAIFTASEVVRRSFIDDFGLAGEQVHTVYAGPNLGLEQLPVRDDARGPPTVLFVGRDFQRGGGDVLVRAMRRVRRDIPEAWLVIAGPPELTLNEMNTRVLGFLDQDSVTGWATLKDAYASADVFCLPSRYEPSGVPFLDAMAFGLPCVGPHAMAAPELIEEGETGYTAPLDDAELLADRLLLLLGNRAHARAMGLAGRRRVEEQFNWSAVVRRMLRVLAPRAKARLARIHAA